MIYGPLLCFTHKCKRDTLKSLSGLRMPNYATWLKFFGLTQARSSALTTAEVPWCSDHLSKGDIKVGSRPRRLM